MAIEIKTLPINDLKINPSNPRIIKNEVYKKLIQSIKDLPEMAEAREIVVNKDLVILGGNMRYQAMKELGYETVGVKIVDWEEDKQRQFIIKDNISNGEWDWDLLANEWDNNLLEDWGLDLPKLDENINDNKEVDPDNIFKDNKTIICPKCKFEFEIDV